MPGDDSKAAPDQVQVSIPKSFFAGRGWLSLVVAGSVAGGVGGGYFAGGLSAEQRLEVVAAVNSVKVEMQESIDDVSEEVSEVSDDLDHLSQQFSNLRTEFAFLRGKFGLESSPFAEDVEDLSFSSELKP